MLRLEPRQSWHNALADGILILARLSIAAVFWQSGRTKMDGWHLSDTAIFLFREEYRLPLLDPTVAAGLAATAEHLLPILLILGLGTRMAAAGLLTMTAVIQTLVYPDAWPTHGTWAVALLLLMFQGAGRVSLDHALQKRRSHTPPSTRDDTCVQHADPEQCLQVQS